MNNYVCSDCGANLDPGEKCNCSPKPKEEKQLITVERLPLISENLKSVKKEIEAEITEAKSLIASEETLSALKARRAALNHRLKIFEDMRKAAKSAIMKPYEDLLEIYDKCVKKPFGCAEKEYSEKISGVESVLYAEKEEAVRTYFIEYAISRAIPWIRFEDANIKVLLSKSNKKLCEEAKAFIDKVETDVTCIKMQSNSLEIMVEYKKTFDLPKSIQTVIDRHKAVESEGQVVDVPAPKKTKAEEIMEALSAPKETPVENKKMLTATFTMSSYDIDDFKTVKALLEKLKQEKGITYEQR